MEGCQADVFKPHAHTVCIKHREKVSKHQALHWVGQVDILCTHPMFGPDSGKASWAGLKFMYEKVRIGSGERRQRRVDQFLEVRPFPATPSLQTFPIGKANS